MSLPFYKYHGAGNDFILVDQMQTPHLTRADEDRIRLMCHRHFGIGADGLILLQSAPGVDFEMVYFNADGREGSMCGNGGRCAVALAFHLGLISSSCVFRAIDGLHAARVVRPDWVELQMRDLDQLEAGDGYFFLDTGSPHYIAFVEDLDRIPVVEAGRQVRYSDRFKQEGTNVNFVEQGADGSLRIATYERGVEDETLACGTGITASALAAFWKGERQEGAEVVVPVVAKGGALSVRFRYAEGRFQDIWLCGPATFVMQGDYQVP